MSSLIILRHLSVENANAIAGLTYGFPAITHFMGFTHALSRKLQISHGLKLEKCGVICHQQQLQAYSSGYDNVFALTRNPLTKEGNTAAFNEEGRMHLTVSLLIECEGLISHGQAGIQALENELMNLCLSQRLAGGMITGIRQVQVVSWPTTSRETRRVMRRLLPGFALLDRSELLEAHYQTLKNTNPQTEMMDAWLDFYVLKQHSTGQGEEGDVPWEYQAKPASGYLVPLMCGYRAISPLYPPGHVSRSRDTGTPFRFSEAVYGVGEWRSPHRITDIETLLWQYQHRDDFYLCCGSQPVSPEHFEFNDED
ncbi:type I-F CRISPR-associated protein Csy2 [Tatumella sp. UBA2305]|uniref:type I-F CRISPR-associated protein Csy2 n=1 Tax=Tatumella sp. UBA2305 TaxID=1947647 RepID=UPI0025F8A35E|nr:type I-F CRISPR-associated protein Csy2 [Tatumella sp. UBA2305]